MIQSTGEWEGVETPSIPYVVMMDIDRISYIFGSFSRRKQSLEANAAKRRSIESPKKIHHDRSKSTPHQSKKQAIISPRAKSVVGVAVEDAKLKCPMCKKQFADPRVLPCLHTFCLKCLEELEKSDFTVWYDDDSDVSAQKTNSPGSRQGSSGGSGYASDIRQDDFSPEKGIRCPSCGLRTEVPPDGIASFPPNYPLQHKIVLAAMNSSATHLLCDLCSSDISAIARCMDCAISFCGQCEEIHLRQKSFAEHQVLSLEEARERGITKVRKQIMCMSHPELELTIFCSSCYQVICRDCIATSHRDHVCEPVSRAAKIHFAKLRQAADRAKAVVEESAFAAGKLSATSKKLEAQCCRVQTEVEKFIEEYMRSVEEHKMRLLEQIKQVREDKLHSISEEHQKLQQRIKDARDIAYFLEDLLNDGSEVEILSFLNPVISKIEKCNNLEKHQDLKVSGSLQFLREEAVKCPINLFTVYGALTTQNVSPGHCQLNVEGLQSLRVGKRVEVTLETRDVDDSPIERGGEEIICEIRHRDAGVSRSLAVRVKDRRDGTYGVSFVPDVAGKLFLSISIRGQPINGSPFTFTVRTIRQHTGTFHCCTFCSSGGSKEATCSCEGKMPGGDNTKTNMSSSLSSRLKANKKHDLIKSHSQAQILASKLRQDGLMSTVEDVIQAVDQVAALLSSNIADSKLSYKDSVINLCQHLKIYGVYLEILFKEQLDHAFKIFRDKAQDDIQVDMLSRLHLLELIELRAKGWKGTDGMALYYRRKINQFGNSHVDMSESISSLNESLSSVIISSSPPLLGPGEVIKPSGKFPKPTRIPGKKYCKDEVVIRNADSGKVNPGAKERLVQITGANEESINHAKQLIEDTIRRNASPVREHVLSSSGGPLTGSSSSINSSASDDSALPGSARASRALMHSLSTNDANIGEFKYTVITNGCTIRITGDNLDLVRTSKLVLDEYFSGEPIHDVTQFYSFDSLPQPILPEEFPTTPLSPPESLPSPEIVTNGESEDTDAVKLRKPRLSVEEIVRGKSSADEKDKAKSPPPKPKHHTYSIEFLAHLAMSPLCLTQPNEWERISDEYPSLKRNVVEYFDAKHYLSARVTEPSGVLSADTVDPSEV
ncbi:hypothetical protein JTB14_032348 [Gonioctena quinquepunctata]|nr:hypothetical protein JTB14_032348 [Gonioctena quinquepunctata]